MKIVGYIVVVDGAGVAELVTAPLTPQPDWPQSGLLFHGVNATLFTSNHLAEKAIKRTVVYALDHHADQWPSIEDYEVVPVVV